MASKTQWLKATWPNLLLISLTTALLSNITYAALPISADQVTNFDALVITDANSDIKPPENIIDDLTYDYNYDNSSLGWRYDKSTGSSPGIITNNPRASADLTKTKLRIRTADGSEFRAVSIDYSAFTGFNPSYSLGLEGYKDGAAVPSYKVTVANIAPP